MTRKTLFAVLIAVAAAGALAFRLPQLRARPMHGDEANQAYKTGILHDQARYRYDPDEHHGPTLYYLTLPVYWLTGADSFAESTETTHRIVPVLFGAGLVLLLLLVLDGLGRLEAVCAGILTAVSPSMVYYSRYYIQEMLLVFFTFLAIAAAWRYQRTRKLGWALAAGAALGLMHATKETCVLAYVAMLVALAAKLGWRAWRSRAVARRRADPPADPTPDAPPSFTPRPYRLGHFAAAAALAVALSVVLFSAFFTDANGPANSVRTYLRYLHRSAGQGSSALHDHPWHYYLSMLIYSGSKSPWWADASLVLAFALSIAAVAALLKRRRAPIVQGGLVPRILAVFVLNVAAVYAVLPAVQGFLDTVEERQRREKDDYRTIHAVEHFLRSVGRGRPRRGPWWSEGLIVALAVAGIVAAKTRCGVARAYTPLIRFLGAYTVVLTIAYAAIPYKTPWCALSFLHGMILLAGVGAVAVVRILPTRPLRALAWVFLALAAYQLAGEAHGASYTFASHRRNPYVYAHTSPDVLRLVERVEALATLHPQGHDMPVLVMAEGDDYWPLPWYLRRFRNLGCWGGLPEGAAPLDASVIIVSQGLQDRLDKRLRYTYHHETRGLRPAVHLVVYIEASLWRAFLDTRRAPAPRGSPP